MTKRIDEYLAQLKDELSDSDPALIQDALADAEEYLQTALETAQAENPQLAKEEALHSIIDKYGAPQEIATAYREMESFITPSLTAVKKPAKQSFLSRYFGVMSDPRAWGASLYAIISLLTGMIYGMWSLFGISLTLITFLLIIGIPVTGLFLLSVRGIALMEGRIIEALLGVRMPRKPLFVSRDLGWKDKFKSLVTDSHTWKSLVYMILQFPLGLIYGGITVILFALSLKAILYPLLDGVFGRPLITLSGHPYYASPWLFPVVSIVGCLLFVIPLHFAKLLGKIHGRYAKALLVKKQ
ncbi:sensor domain-containing protein [Acidobacteriota bacterium]